MELQDFLDHVSRGAPIEGGSEQHVFMHRSAQEALGIVAELNSGYRTPDEVNAVLSQLTGKAVEESVTVFPPFYCEFGKNLTLGKSVFINMGCLFQDTGGITIGDGTLVGHGSTLTTLNHAVDPDRRADMIPAPVVIGRKVWLGADQAQRRMPSRGVFEAGHGYHPRCRRRTAARRLPPRRDRRMGSAYGDRTRISTRC